MSGAWYILIPVAIGIVVGSVKGCERREVLRQPLDPALSPGMICDRVAAKTESKPTVGWYHACINYAAELQREQAA